MSGWKTWQNVAFLIYLLLLNVIVYVALGAIFYYGRIDELLLKQPAVVYQPAILPTTSTNREAGVRSQELERGNEETLFVNSLPTNTATFTPSPTNTPKPTATFTPSPTDTPKPTATFTPSPTDTPKPTATFTPSPTDTPKPTMTVTPSSTNTDGLTEVAMLLPSNSVSLSAVETTGIIEAIPLTNNNVALSWTPTKRNAEYRIYSDMGTGYGVYLYKGSTNQPAFLDQWARPGANYNYRVTHQDDIERFLYQADVTTFGNAQPVQPVITSIIPAPTALPPDTILLGLVSDNNFTDKFNTLHIAGEVRNDSNLDVSHGRVVVTFYDAGGAIIGTTTGQTLLDVIPPGEISPFSITLSHPTGLSSYSLRAVARSVATQSQPQLSVIEVRHYEDNIGFLHIKGVVENVGQFASKHTQVAAIIYGRNGQVINVGFAVTDPPIVHPGRRATYDVTFTYYPRYSSQRVIPYDK